MAYNNGELFAILVTILQNISWGKAKDRATKVENLVRIVAKEHGKKTCEEEIEGWLSTEASIIVKTINRNLAAYFAPGTLRLTSIEIRRMARNIIEKIPSLILKGTKKTPRPDFLINQMAAERLGVKQQEELQVMAEIARIKEAGIVFEDGKKISASLRYRFQAKKNLKNRRSKDERMKALTSITPSAMQMMIMRIFSADPKTKVRSIAEIKQALIGNGYNDKTTPRKELITNSVLELAHMPSVVGRLRKTIFPM